MKEIQLGKQQNYYNSMETEITKFRQKERIRRLYFKHRGNINAIIEETSITKKIQKSFRHDVSFEIACFITDAILEGVEQRKIILEDRLQEILKAKRIKSICCKSPVSEHKYEGSIWYKCKKCGGNCEVEMADEVNDGTVVKLIDRMRREDELLSKFLIAMGIVVKTPNILEEKKTKQESSSKFITVQSAEALPPGEQKLLEKLSNLDESKISEIRRFVEEKVDEAVNENS